MSRSPRTCGSNLESSWEDWGGNGHDALGDDDITQQEETRLRLREREPILCASYRITPKRR